MVGASVPTGYSISSATWMPGLGTPSAFASFDGLRAPARQVDEDAGLFDQKRNLNTRTMHTFYQYALNVGRL